MKKIKKLFKNYYLIAFFIPFFILFLTYFINGIYWKSDTSPLLGDGFHQYVIFDVTLRNIFLSYFADFLNVCKDTNNY